ncbi:LAMI_0H10902g1_1 [Lachancea mirantina]|uniref:LAMI_0H10902g1_1 n=1 Tax=Lachancea mirantina TaxID=1230905 RepID=A0A1G4KGT6_9SACH|nr:LAMI_0H10902g1_1 [Lachancea mirantina]
MRSMQDHPSLLHRWDHSYAILSTVAFPHKKLLFAGTHDSKILCFNLDTYNLVQTVSLGNLDDEQTHTRSSVLCLAKSQDERFLFSAGADSLVRVWEVTLNTRTSCVSMKELATIYSSVDIGDVFSVKYLDSHQTVIFGCQNASMLFLPNVLDKMSHSKNYSDLNCLPQLRFDKFFDSTFRGGPGTVSRTSSSDQLACSVHSKPVILEVPAENTIKYAHNGFIYSIQPLNDHNHSLPAYFYPSGVSRDDVDFVISCGGDGISKLWSLTLNADSSANVTLVTEYDNDESILCEFVKFPFLYCGLNGGRIKIWDINTNEPIATLQAPSKSDLMSITVYNDHIFATHKEGITKFHEENIYHWKAHQGLVLSAEILRKKCTCFEHVRLVTGGNDGALALWDINDLVDSVCENLDYQTLQVKERRESEDANSLGKYEDTFFGNEHMLESLRELISFQTVSALADTQHSIHGRRCASYLQQLLLKFGATTSELLCGKSGSNPIVYAVFHSKAANKNRVLWYAHYDVVAAGDPAAWESDPFALTCENGHLKGRGVSDNKGPLLAAIYSVGWLHYRNELNNDIVFLIEGQEESDSSGFSEILGQHIDRIGSKIDWVLFSNSIWLDQTMPCLNYGLRGVINAKITITSEQPDRHSGVDGGMHREPTSDLFRIISKLQDDEGNVQIPGFYDSLKELSESEANHFKEILARAALDDNIGMENLITRWTKPSFSITTMKVSGPGNATVIPQKASICLSIRLVPEQDLNIIKCSLESYLLECFQKLKTTNKMDVKILNEAEPWLGDPHNRIYLVLSEEIKEAWGKEPLLVREGGSIPQIRYLERIFDAPAAHIPCGQSTDNAHLANEQLRIINWYKTRRILTNTFNKL